MPPLRNFGTHRDIPDPRDTWYVLPRGLRNRLPAKVDLSREFAQLPVYNQGRLNSCSAHAIAAAMWYAERTQGRRGHAPPSRLFIYYNERAREGRTICRDVPVSLRDGYKIVKKKGSCPEGLWPYEVGRFWRQPTARCYKAAKRHKVLEYHRIKRHLDYLRGCLSEGFPFAMGMNVFKGFTRLGKSGKVLMPASDARVIGGHAVLVVGYDDKRQHFIVRNSFGAKWGKKGHCFLPYAFLLHKGLSWDFWMVRLVR